MVLSSNDHISWEHVKLRHVSIHKSKQETCVEELGKENSIGNLSQLSTISILFNPHDKFDNNHSKNGVDNDDHSSNGVTQHC